MSAMAAPAATSLRLRGIDARIMCSLEIGHVSHGGPCRHVTRAYLPGSAARQLYTNMPLTGWTVGWVENPSGLECRRPAVPPPVIVHFGPITPKC